MRSKTERDSPDHIIAIEVSKLTFSAAAISLDA